MGNLTQLSGNAAPLISRARRDALEGLERRREIVQEKIEELDKLDELRRKRAVYLTDLFAFAKEVLGFKELTEDLHRPICDKISNEEILRSLWLLPRGHFKTTILSIAYPLWVLCRNQDARIALISKAAAKSEENLEEIVDRARRPEFQRYFGDVIGHPDEWPVCRKDRIKIRRSGSTTGPSIAAYSTESSEVGRHFDVMIFDDIVDQENVSSEHTREGVWSWLGRQFAVCDPGRKVIVIGTRWHWDDVYSRIMKRFPRYDGRRALGWLVTIRRAIENGKPIFPSRFTHEVLSELKEVMGPYTYSCFYDNSPTGEGTNPFRVRDFRWIPRENNREGWRYILVDPAGTKEEYSSYTGIIIGDAYPRVPAKPHFVVKEAILKKVYPKELVDDLLALIEIHKPYTVVIEDEAYQKALYGWLRQEMLYRGMAATIRLIKNPRNVGQEFRLLALEPLLAGKKIAFELDMPGRDALIEEFETYPKGPHRDLIAAMWFVTQIWYPPINPKATEPDVIEPRLRLLNEISQRRFKTKGVLPHLQRL